MGVYRTVSVIKGDICKKNPTHPRAFNAPAEGFPLEFCNGSRSAPPVLHGLSMGGSTATSFNYIATLLFTPCLPIQLEFGMYPQSMPTEWTHARTLRPWQSVRLDL